MLWGKRGGHDILGNTVNPENMECSVNIYCSKLKRAVSLKRKKLDLLLRIEQEKHQPRAFSWEMNFIRVTVIVYCPCWWFWLGWDLISTSVLTVGIITSLCNFWEKIQYESDFVFSSHQRETFFNTMKTDSDLDQHTYHNGVSFRRTADPSAFHCFWVCNRMTDCSCPNLEWSAPAA